MGNESSIATSINSLSDCLDTVEKRLFAIEDIHFHHQAAISVDNCVIVSGVKIVCNPEVQLLVGPVLGTIGSTFIRVLLEVDQDCELTIHVFRADKTLIKDRHFLSQSFKILACVPKVMQVDGLLPGESYVSYIGGLTANDTINVPLQCQTINSSLSNFQLIAASPGQVGSIERDVQDFYVDLAQQLSVPTPTHTSTQKQRIVYLNGDILSLDMISGKYIMDLLAAIDANNISDAWITVLNEFEAKLCEIYRQFYNHYALQGQGHFRHCSWILIAGAQESSMGIYRQYMYTKNMTLANNNEKLLNDSYSIGKSERDEVNDQTSKKTPSSWISKKKQDFSSENPSNNTSAHNDKIPEKETSKSIFGAQMKSELSTIKSEVVKSAGEIGECHRLLISAAARVQRRCYYKYFRQLWDDKYEELMMEEEKEMEERFRKVLSIKTSIIKQSHLLYTFQQAQQHNERLFNTPDNTTTASIKHLTDKLATLSKQLLQQFHSLANNKNTAASLQNVNLLSLGQGLCVVVVDAQFGYIEGSDGLIKNPMPVTMELTTENWRLFETAIQQSNLAQETILRLEPPFHNTPSLEILKSIIFLSNSTYFDSTAAAATGSNNNKMTLSKPDFIRFLRLLSTWQSHHETHSVVINTTSSTSCFHNSGYLDTRLLLTSELANVDFNNTAEKMEFISSMLTVEKVKRLKTTVAVQVMGKCTHRQANFIERLFLQQSSLQQSKLQLNADALTLPKDDEQIDLIKLFVPDIKSRFTKSGVFTIEQSQQSTSMALTTSFQPFHTANNTQFKIKCVIGNVTTHSANIICETASNTAHNYNNNKNNNNGFIEMMLFDMITGFEFICGKSAIISGKVEVFMFGNLLPNHSYELRMMTASSNGQHVVCCGGFTTMRISSMAENKMNVHRSHLRQRMRERAVHITAAAAAADSHHAAGNEEEEISVENQMSITPSLLLQQHSAVAAAADDDKDSSNQNSTIRLLCLGSILPFTTQHMLASISSAQGDELTALRKHTSFLTDITGLCKQPWNGIDLVLHLGTAVDWSVVLLRVIALLAQAEQQTQQHVQLQSELVSQAVDHLRDAYRICWGEHIIISEMLAYSSHYFISSPLTSLLQTMHTSTIRQLEHDLSSFIVHHLLLGMQTVQEEYQLILSQTSLNQSLPSHSEGHIRFIGDNLSTLLIDLQPRLALDHHNGSGGSAQGGGGGGLLSVTQLETVRQLLITHVNEIHTVLFASPLPLILLDELYSEHTFLIEFEPSLQYSLVDVLLVLDLCASWLLSNDDNNNASNDKKQVVFLCATTSVSFESTISIYPQQEAAAAAAADHIPQQEDKKDKDKTGKTALKTITQICCGPVLGLANSFSSPLAGMLYSRTLPVQFGFEHVVSAAGQQQQAAEREQDEAENVLIVQKPLIGLVEIATNQPVETHLLDAHGILDYKQAHIDRYSNDISTSSRLQDDEIQADTKDLTVQIIKHLYYPDKYPTIPSDATEEVMSMLKDIYHAVEILINREHVVITQIVELLSEGKEFPLYIGEHLHEASVHFGGIIRTVFAELSEDSKDILRLPNNFIFLLTFEVLASEVMGSSADGATVTMLMTTISAEKQLFEHVLRIVLSMQLAMECVALQRGLLD